MLDVKYEYLLRKFDPSEQYLDEEKTFENLQGHNQLDFVVLFEKECAAYLVPTDLRLVLLLEHLHAVDLHALEHIDAGLLSEARHDFVDCDSVAFEVDGPQLLDFVAVEGVTLNL